MPSPVGHLIAGYAVHSVMRERITEKNGYVLAAVLFSALAADLDFLPGIMVGAPGRFHHGVSHSLGAALLYGIGIWGILRCSKVKDAFQLAILFATVYASHVILDYLAADTGAPFGVPLWWPLSNTYHIASFPVFMDVKWLKGETTAFFASIVSAHNLIAAVWEVVVLMPMVVWTQRRGKAERTSLALCQEGQES